MDYVALYRKYRPQRFQDVTGQDAIVTTLKNQVISSRIVHAYLFCGTRGTGKTSLAKIFARAVNCEQPNDGSPCGECQTCKDLAISTEMNVIEIDAASNRGIESIRVIIDEVSYSPINGKFKVYIIDEAHMLTTEAFNALLKTLEEPPGYVIFILATTDVNKLPATILSRCQRYDFKRITIDTIVERLRFLTTQEGIEVEEKALRYIARSADGSMRDAISLLDQCVSFYFGQELTYDKTLDVLGALDVEVFSRLLRACLKGDVYNCITILKEIIALGRELGQFVLDFTWYLRNLLLLQSASATTENAALDDAWYADLIDATADTMERMKEETSLASSEVFMRYIRIFSELTNQIRYASNKRVLLEIALIKLCKPSMETDTQSLLDRVRHIEELIESGAINAKLTTQVNEKPPDKPAAPAPKPTLAKESPKEETSDSASPEGLEKLVANWDGIIEHIGMPIRSFLKSAKPSCGENDILQIMAEEGLAYEHLSKKKEELEQIFSKAARQPVKVEIRSAKADTSQKEKPSGFDKINADIVTEDDD
jgi:DNA polymerase-3 subunit gamma/tau